MSYSKIYKICMNIEICEMCRLDIHALLKKMSYFSDQISSSALYPIPPEMKFKKRIGNLISHIALINNAHIFKADNNL